MIFLFIAAAIQFVMLSRIVRTQRLQIGIMKALGYSSLRIMFHYTEYALMVSSLGAALGTVFGLMLASVMSRMYMELLQSSQAIGGVNQDAIVNGIILSLVISTLSGLAASRSVTGLRPAEAMHSEPPKRSAKCSGTLGLGLEQAYPFLENEPSFS
jgi:putative ABC transport system permease protein